MEKDPRDYEIPDYVLEYMKVNNVSEAEYWRRADIWSEESKLKAYENIARIEQEMYEDMDKMTPLLWVALSVPVGLMVVGVIVVLIWVAVR